MINNLFLKNEPSPISNVFKDTYNSIVDGLGSREKEKFERKKRTSEKTNRRKERRRKEGSATAVKVCNPY